VEPLEFRQEAIIVWIWRHHSINDWNCDASTAPIYGQTGLPIVQQDGSLTDQGERYEAGRTLFPTPQHTSFVKGPLVQTLIKATASKGKQRTFGHNGTRSSMAIKRTIPTKMIRIGT